MLASVLFIKVFIFLILFSKDLKPLFNSNFPHFLIMNKLTMDNKLSKVLDLFEKQLPEFSIEKSNSLLKEHRRKSILPFDQMNLVFEVLLKIVINFFVIVV